jgi:hypothetical protein
MNHILGFPPEAHSVLCEVRTERCICSVEHCSLCSGRAMAQAVSRRPVTAETRSRVSRCDSVKLGQFSS